MLHDGASWPDLSRATLAGYRARYGPRIAELAESDSDLAIASGFGDRRIVIQDCLDHADNLDRVITTLERSFLALAAEGTLLGVPHVPFADGPDVLEAEYAVDGADHHPVPTSPRRVKAVRFAEAEDPRWERMKEMLDRLPKLHKARIDYVTLAAKTQGHLSGKADDEDQSDVQRQREAEELFESLRRKVSERPRVPVERA